MFTFDAITQRGGHNKRTSVSPSCAAHSADPPRQRAPHRPARRAQDAGMSSPPALRIALLSSSDSRAAAAAAAAAPDHGGAKRPAELPRERGSQQTGAHEPVRNVGDRRILPELRPQVFAKLHSHFVGLFRLTPPASTHRRAQRVPMQARHPAPPPFPSPLHWVDEVPPCSLEEEVCILQVQSECCEDASPSLCPAAPWRPVRLMGPPPSQRSKHSQPHSD
ncbi:unnamed protein product [Pleuronectes platessa]|uniref:Uncharacterized protein n=1 Tax=Pleuronectes platessa TaxID=8262 RepID=A0A9N7TU58_PLEPL|nr:unnamed protein product [Pleuronectes platessa]